MVGIHLDPHLSSTVVYRGPSPKEEEAVREWDRLWGEVSETRRFKDGAIVHAVVWTVTPQQRHTVPLQAARHILRRHLAVDPASIACNLGGLDDALAAPGSGISHTSSILIARAYDKVASAIRTLEDLPLAIVSIQPCGASFAHTEEFPPAPAAPGAPPPLGSPLLRFVIIFESSGKWPDDLEAISALKTAFYLKLAALLESKARLTCEPTRDELIVQSDGFTCACSLTATCAPRHSLSTPSPARPSCRAHHADMRRAIAFE